MKLYKKLFIPMIFIILQPVFLQCPVELPVEVESPDNLVKKYTADHIQREKHNTLYHRLFNNEKYTAAKEAQEQLDNKEVVRLKNDEQSRNEILNKKEWWHRFVFKPKDIALAEHAQEEIDLIKKMADELQDQNLLSKQSIKDIPFGITEKLNNYNTQDLIILAKTLSNQNQLCPRYLSLILNDKFSTNSKDFPDDGVKYLILTDDIIDKLVSFEKIKLDPNKSIIKDLITENQVDSFLQSKKYQDINPKELLALRKAFGPRDVPEKLQEALDKAYAKNPKAFERTDRIYISEKVKKEVEEKIKVDKAKAEAEKKEAEARAKEEQKKARAKAEAQERAKAEREDAEARAKAKTKREEADTNAKASTQAKQEEARAKAEAQERAKAEAREKEEKAKARAEREKAEAEAGRRADKKSPTEFVLGHYLTKEQISFLNKILEIAKQSNNRSVMERVKGISTISDISDIDAWKNFYKAASLVVHPDKVNELLPNDVSDLEKAAEKAEIVESLKSEGSKPSDKIFKTLNEINQIINPS